MFIQKYNQSICVRLCVVKSPLIEIYENENIWVTWSPGIPLNPPNPLVQVGQSPRGATRLLGGGALLEAPLFFQQFL